MMKDMVKRILAVVIAVMVCIDVYPISIYAGGLEDQEALITEDQEDLDGMQEYIEDTEDTGPQDQAFGNTTYYTMSVGDTKYLYTNAGNRAVTGAAWTSSNVKAVDILSQSSVSCQIKVKAYTSSTPIIIHCLYYFNELRNGYIFVRSDYTDYYITVQQPKSITVRLEANGGDIPTSSISVQQGNTYGDLPTPFRYGYTFQGWYTASSGGSRVSSTTTVNRSSDHTLYAQWSADTYSIKFNGNGNTSGSMADMTGCSYGTRYTLTANRFIRDGYTFGGWNTAANGSGRTYKDKASVSDLASRGSVTLYAIWNLNTKDISGCTIAAEASSYTYDGTAKVPRVTVKHGDVVLTENEDYIVSYSGNTDAGTADIVVKGIGDYSGEITESFTIYKADQAFEAHLEQSSIKIGEDTVITAKGLGAITFRSDDASIAEVSPEGKIRGISAGKTVITAMAAGDSNHNGADRSFTISVTESQMDLSACEVTLDVSGYTYDGTSKTPKISVKNGETVLKKDVDYGLSYSDNINAGTASVVVKGIGSYGGTVTKTFMIYKAGQKIDASISSTQIIVGKTAAITASGHGTVSYRSDDSSIATVDRSGIVKGIAAGKTVITVEAAGDKNYQAGTKKITVTVEEKTEDLSTPSLKSVFNRKDGVVLRWSAVDNADKYHIYRKTGTKNWSYIGYVRSTSCIDKNVSSGTAYTYTVIAANGKAYSGHDSKGLKITYLSAPSISSLYNSSRGVSITWNAVGGASSYKIYRGDRLLKTVYSGRVTSYTDGNARINSAKYIYTVYACKGNAQSGASPAKTIYYLRNPSILKLQRLSGQRFMLIWSRNTGATGYEILYSRNRNFSSGVNRKTFYTNRSTYMISPKLSPKGMYYVRIRTYKKISGITYYSGWIQTSVYVR